MISSSTSVQFAYRSNVVAKPSSIPLNLTGLALIWNLTSLILDYRMKPGTMLESIENLSEIVDEAEILMAFSGLLISDYVGSFAY
ncbi:hypothetical protein Tco_0132302 [Tanacetum coccineum]